MKEKDNIEKLFKDTFEHFEADVNPNVWTNVQSSVNAASGSAASSAATFTAGKIAAGALSIALISGSIWYFTSAEKDPGAVIPPALPPSEKISMPDQTPAITVTQEPQSQNTERTIGPERNSDWQVPPSVRTLNQYHTEADRHSTPAPKNADQIISTDVSAIEHPATTSSGPPSKYGNATQGDGGMIRGTQGTYSPFSNTQAAANDNSNEAADSRAAAISVSTSYGDAPLTVDFYNQGVATSLNWDFGDGSTSRDNSPRHTFERPGNYAVKLTTRNSSGTTSDVVNIEVRAVSSISYIPNIFTPNGDGENDYFFFETKNIVSVGVAIYSQKEGTQIYTWNTLDGKWNGKMMNGQDAPEGVYLYSIQANGSDGVVHSKKGFVTLSVKR